MLTQYLFVFLAFVLDGVINTLFPINNMSLSIQFIPCIGLCALVISVKNMKMLDSLLMTIIFGLFYSYFYTNTLFLNVVIFILVVLITKFWFRNVGNSFFESVVVCSAAIFIKELLLYIFYSIDYQSTISFNFWLFNRVAFTILINDILFGIIYMFNTYKENYILRREVERRKDEKINIYRPR